MESLFENGTYLLRVNHYSKNGAEVSLELDEDEKVELLQNAHDKVDLLSPYMHQSRDLLYMYLGELIELLPAVKEEGIANEEVVSVFETLLLALDYLTDTQYLKVDFKQEYRDYVSEVIQDCFELEKRHSFLTNANRPRLNKEKIMQSEDKVYTLDNRLEKTRIYMAVFYEKPSNLFEHFRHVGSWLAKLDLKPESSRISYEDYMKGMTDLELHQDFLFEINRVKRAFSWFLNSYSCRENQFAVFDEIDLRSKLGIR